MSNPPILAAERLRTSELLVSVLTTSDRERLTIGDLIDGLGDRAFGILILICALPNCVPAPPGTSTLTGLPIILFSLQILAGAHRPWLPDFLRRRDFSRADLLRIVRKVEPWLQRFEKLCRPRLTSLIHGPAERLAGLMLFWLSFILILPIFLGNLPPAIAIAAIALALLEHDGLAVLVGHIGAIVASVIAGASVLAQLVVVFELVHWLLSVHVRWPY